MKKIFTLLVAMVITASSFAQFDNNDHRGYGHQKNDDRDGRYRKENDDKRFNDRDNYYADNREVRSEGYDRDNHRIFFWNSIGNILKHERIERRNDDQKRYDRFDDHEKNYDDRYSYDRR